MLVCSKSNLIQIINKVMLVAELCESSTHDGLTINICEREIRKARSKRFLIVPL